MLAERRLVIVTGKGGTGKSTVAAALAWQSASAGRRVLACELDAKGDLGACLAGAGGGVGAAPPTYEPHEAHPGLWVMGMDPEASLKEYLRLHLRLPLVTRIGLLSNVFDFVASAAPGVREIVTIGKCAYEVRECTYDLVVVDATAAGHVMGLLRAPDAINALVGAGLIRSQTAWVRDILNDRVGTALFVVTTPEEMPVTETLELCARVPEETGVRIGGVIVNRVLPEPFSRHERVLAEALATGAGRARLARVAGGDAIAGSLLQAGRLAQGLRVRQAQHLDRLVRSVAADVPLVLVPQLFDAERGVGMTRRVAELLAEEW